MIACYFLKIKFSLAVIAGILTIIGYSVNDSIVLWCHIQTHSVKAIGTDKTPKDIVGYCVDSVLSRVVLTSVSTIIPALSIIILNISELKDFSLISRFGNKLIFLYS